MLRWEGLTLSSHFQPLYSVRRESCIGYEALIRATDSRGVPIAPALLFAEAFADGRGVQLDWICRALHLRSFARIDPGNRKLCINVHPEAAVQDSGSAQEFADLIRFYGMVPRRICVEILEDRCADEPLLRKVVGAYRTLGCSIAMDDFGLGCSNIDRIVALRPDFVKVDRSILIDAVGDTKARTVLPAIVDLIREAGAQVVIEGVESANEALIAIEAGADQVQGNYFAMPAGALSNESMGASMMSRLLRIHHVGTAVAG